MPIRLSPFACDGLPPVHWSVSQPRGFSSGGVRANVVGDRTKDGGRSLDGLGSSGEKPWKRSILAYKPGRGGWNSVLGAFFFFFLGLFNSFFLSTNLTISKCISIGSFFWRRPRSPWRPPSPDPIPLRCQLPSRRACCQSSRAFSPVPKTCSASKTSTTCRPSSGMRPSCSPTPISTSCKISSPMLTGY